MMLSMVGRTSAHIVAIGSLNRQADGKAMPLAEQAAFHPALAPLGGIRTVFSPPNGADAAWPRPSRATPGRCHTVPQTAPVLLARG